MFRRDDAWMTMAAARRNSPDQDTSRQRLSALFALLVLAATALLMPDSAGACGPDSDCMIGERTYRIRLPEGIDGKTRVGAVFYAHGHRGSAAGAMQNAALGEAVSDLGLALVALKSSGEGWTLPGSPSSHRGPVADEVAYVEQVLEDATARFPIDRKRTMAAGFSAGGMLVWNVLCEKSDLFAAYLPLSGTFWRPVPDRCPAPVTNILHIHGDADKVVPLTGREIGPTRQGDVREVLEMYATRGGFGPATAMELEGLKCEHRRNQAGRMLDFCLFEGGHGYKADYIRLAWRRFAAAGLF